MDPSITAHQCEPEIKSDYHKTSNEKGPPDIWDSLESDTESLGQEKAYQRELHKRIWEKARETSSSNDATEKVDSQKSDDECSEPQNTNSSSAFTMRDEHSDSKKHPRQLLSDENANYPDCRKKQTEDELLQSNLSSCEPGKTLHSAVDISAGKRHKYVVVHNPVVAEMDTVHERSMLSSFHLHPQQDQMLQSTYTSPEIVPHSISDNATKIKNTSERWQKQQIQGNGQYDGEKQSNDQEDVKGEFNLVPHFRSVSQSVRPSNSRKDILERNKATLGIQRHKQGSYLKAYEQRGGKPNAKPNQPIQSAESSASTDSPGISDNGLDPELMSIRKTEKLKIHNQSSHSDRARFELHMNQPGERRVSAENQQTLSSSDSGSISHRSSPLAPIINLNTPDNSAKPSLNTELQFTLALPPPLQRRIRSEGFPPKFEEIFKSNGSETVHCEVQSHDSSVELQTHGGAYPVLPPIGRSNSSDTDLCSGRTQQTTNGICQGSSEGYLAQLQKQIQNKKTYKEYTLKDYRSLNQGVKLGGLGPSSTVAEDLAEKIRRQKLYSNVIREQNKKISRIPFLLGRSPVGNDNKVTIPRNKALEYAKMIVRPKAPLHLKPKEKKSENERVFEHSAYLQLGVDLSQLAALELLRKRHEQEKQVVEHFTSLNAKTSSPSVNTH